MKKNFILFIATALLLAVSCIKEEANVAGEKELITVKLNPLTKTQLDPDGTNTFWSEGDVVSVSVGGNKIGDLTLVEDDVFSGEIESGYDNNDEVVLNYPSGVTDVPSVQEAVENSFANGSALLEGTTTIGNLRKGKGASLQNKTALLQFSVAYDGDVTFSVGSKKYTVTGCIADALYYACIEPVVDASLSFTLSEVGGLKSKPTVTFEANKLYKLGELDIVKTDRNLAFPLSAYTETYGNDFAEPQLSGVVDDVTYSSNNTAVAVVDPKTGAITLKGGGTAVITAQVSDNRTYYGGSASYTLTVNKADRNLAFVSPSVSKYLHSEFTITPNGVTDGVSYESSNTSVATVDATTGKVTILAPGSTTITASAKETATHNLGKATYTVEVPLAEWNLRGTIGTIYMVKSDVYTDLYVAKNVNLDGTTKAFVFVNYNETKTVGAYGSSGSNVDTKGQINSWYGSEAAATHAANIYVSTSDSYDIYFSPANLDFLIIKTGVEEGTSAWKMVGWFGSESSNQDKWSYTNGISLKYNYVLCAHTITRKLTTSDYFLFVKDNNWSEWIGSPGKEYGSNGRNTTNYTITKENTHTVNVNNSYDNTKAQFHMNNSGTYQIAINIGNKYDPVTLKFTRTE